ncbi:MAG: flavodoxin [Lachnospiraceae bacterium]|nr:flavodoxin [Lachnospiraceae bacterium]
MKRILSIIMMAALLLTSLAACGNNAKAEMKEAQAVTEGEKETAENTDTAGSESVSADTEASSDTSSNDTDSESGGTTAHSDVLVAYFSATGTTKGVAEKIAAITGGDLYEILPAEPYSDADLNWNDRNSRSTKEQNDKSVRPEIGSEDISLEGYTTVYLGFPIWWGEEPRILDTFVEKYSFEGITVVPFCTSSSSGIGRSGPNMEALAGSGNWLDGKRFGGNVSEADLQSWIESLK